MINVTHVVWGMDIGGTENMLADIINRQVDSVHVNLIIIDKLTTNSIVERLDKRVKINKINRKQGKKSLLSLVKLNWVVFMHAQNIIHCHTPSLAKFIFIHKIIKSKLYLTCHATNISFSNYSKYDKIFTISKAVKQDLLDRYKQHSVEVINGIDFDKFNRVKATTNSDVFSIIQVSRLEHVIKGQEVMLNALAYLVHKLDFKKVKYTLIGDGPSAKFLIDLAEKLYVSKYCDFQGSVDRSYIYKNLNNYDLLVQPSFYEGFGLTVVEGMAAKIPVLVSNIEGPLDIVKNGKYGYIFETGDYQSLANKIEEIKIASSKKKFIKWLDDNFDYAKNNFDINYTAKTYLSEY